MKKTAVEWIIEEINQQQKKYIDLAKKDKSLKKGVDAILTATTLLKMKCEQAKEMEKQQIIDAFNEGWLQCNIYGLPEKSRKHFETAEQYYNETFGESTPWYDEDKVTERMNIIGQNGNEGEHYK